jgi:hypothetical protein
MCFVDKALSGIGTGQSNLFKTATQQGQAEFGAANTEFNDLTKAMNPIVAAGPDQPGWSAAENNAINSQTINQTAAAYKNAAVAVKGDIAGQGGGNIALPTGVNLGTEEALAEAGAQAESAGLSANTIANYKQGNEDWQFASKAVEASPEMFATANQGTQAATGAGSAASTTEQAINSAQNSWQQMAIAGLSDAASVGSAGLSSMASSSGSSVPNFFQAGGGAGPGSPSGVPVSSAPIPNVIS